MNELPPKYNVPHLLPADGSMHFPHEQVLDDLARTLKGPTTPTLPHNLIKGGRRPSPHEQLRLPTQASTLESEDLLL